MVYAEIIGIMSFPFL